MKYSLKIYIAVYIKKKSFAMHKRTNEPSITLINPINEQGIITYT